jgi:hypothetical protein
MQITLRLGKNWELLQSVERAVYVGVSKKYDGNRNNIEKYSGDKREKK